MITSDIFNIKPQTTRSIKSRESQTFKHQNIFNQDEDQNNKDKINLDPQDKSIEHSPLRDNINKYIDNNNLPNQQLILPSENEDYSRNRKFKSWQSNIFNEPAKENFNRNLSRQGINPQDKVDLGAFNINWWDTQNYPQISQNSPAKIIQENHTKYKQEQLTPQIQQQNEIRKNNKNYSDIFDSGLSRYYDQPITNSIVITQTQKALPSNEIKKLQISQQQQQSIQQNVAQSQYNDQSQEDLNLYAKRQKLRGMSSVFDTHDYYNQLIQDSQTPHQKPQNNVIVIKEDPVQIDNEPQQSYVKLIVRGLNQKFDKEKFRQFCQNQHSHVAQITLDKDEKKRMTHQFIIKCSLLNQKDLTKIEMYLLSQSGRIVRKDIINKEDYIANLGHIQESNPNKNLKIANNIAKENKSALVVQKRAQSAKQLLKKKN